LCDTINAHGGFKIDDLILLLSNIAQYLFSMCILYYL